MGRALFLLLVVVCCALVAGVSGYEDQWRWEDEEGGGEEGGTGRPEGVDRFLLPDSKQVVKTDAGNMRVVRGFGGKFMKSPLHIGFITMEPRSLFIPQYLDSSLILFIREGEARIGHIYKDNLVEKHLKAGDVYRIEAGSAFYLINAAEGQILHTICSIDTSESLGWHTFQSFFIGGGTYPMSILSGFDHLTLSTAFNVSIRELKELLTRQQAGPIISLSNSQTPSIWTGFLELKHHQKLAHLKRVVHLKEKSSEEPKWSFRKLLISVFGKATKKRKDKKRKGPGSYNIYDRKPDFKNNYGYSIALDESAYSPLGHSDASIYLVNLSAGSMMAPHDVIQDANTTRTSQWKDPLIVDDGPLTRLRANRIKQAMGLLAQATVDDTMSYTQKEASSMLGSKSESTWINVLEAAENEGGNFFHAAA